MKYAELTTHTLVRAAALVAIPALLATRWAALGIGFQSAAVFYIARNGRSETSWRPARDVLIPVLAVLAAIVFSKIQAQAMYGKCGEFRVCGEDTVRFVEVLTIAAFGVFLTFANTIVVARYGPPSFNFLSATTFLRVCGIAQAILLLAYHNQSTTFRGGNLSARGEWFSGFDLWLVLSGSFLLALGSASASVRRVD